MIDLAADDPTVADFNRWMSERRLLGRDRLWPCFRDAWALGYASGVDQVLEQQHHIEDSDK